LELENLVEILNRFRGKKEEKNKWDGSDAFTFFPFNTQTASQPAF
jgi:hypothetical protein